MNTDNCIAAQPVLTERQPWILGLSLTLGLLALWTLTHRYRGLTNDGVLYSLQALARIHPYLAKDVVFSGTSQDSFTLFPALYAALMQRLGIIAASTLLFFLCRASYFLAAWLLIRRLFDSRVAYLTISVLICVSSEYGAWSIFHCAEDFLTARTVAESCVLGAIAAYYWNQPWTAAGLLGFGMLVHPLMALPGVLLLLCLVFSARMAATAAAVGLAGVAVAALAAIHGLAPLESLKSMDPAWLEIVEERSMFIFLKHWRMVDWEVQLRPLLFLLVAHFVIPDIRVRKLCWAAGLVGLTGLAVAAIPDIIGPIPILLQGQAWRWIWVTCLVAACLAAPSASLLWRTGGWGQLCASLLMMGWIFPPVEGEIAFAGAGIIWALRSYALGLGKIPELAARAIIVIIAAWTVTNVWELIDNTVLHSTVAPDAIALTRWAFSLTPLALTSAWLMERTVRGSRFARFAVPGLLAAAATCFLSSSLFWPGGFDAIRVRDQYRSWREAIPESSSVLVLSTPPVFALFPWFTLERTSYTSSSQSAGVVFSEKTAEEIRRRSQVLIPVIPPNWKAMSDFRRPAAEKIGVPVIPSLTSKGLEEICSDAELGFVVAKDYVGFSPQKHVESGEYMDWNLYDCRQVRSSGSNAS